MNTDLVGRGPPLRHLPAAAHRTAFARCLSQQGETPSDSEKVIIPEFT